MALERFLQSLLPKRNKSFETTTHPIKATHDIQTPEELARLIELAKERGVIDAGTSSWGPPFQYGDHSGGADDKPSDPHS